MVYNEMFSALTHVLEAFPVLKHYCSVVHENVRNCHTGSVMHDCHVIVILPIPVPYVPLLYLKKKEREIKLISIY